jgi:hypothetical protein
VGEERGPEVRSERPGSEWFREKTGAGRRREGARCDGAEGERRRRRHPGTRRAQREVEAGDRHGQWWRRADRWRAREGPSRVK